MCPTTSQRSPTSQRRQVLGPGTRSRGNQAQAQAGPRTLEQAAAHRPLLVPAWLVLAWQARQRMWALRPWVSTACSPTSRGCPCDSSLCTQLCTIWELMDAGVQDHARVSMPVLFTAHMLLHVICCMCSIHLLLEWLQQGSLVNFH